MKKLVKKILKEELQKINEGPKDIVITLATLLSLGLSRVNAQELKNNQPKLMLINKIYKYNKNPKGPDTLKQILLPKMGEKTDLFIDRYLEFQPDRTVIVKPNFIKGLNLNYNPRSKDFGFTYTLKF